MTLWAPWRAAPEPAKPVLFQIAPPPGVNLAANFSLSPDGTKLAFNGSGSDGVLRVWVRTMDTLESRALAGTEGLTNAPLFWSPDSRFIAFDAGGKLKKVDVAGGPSQTICDVSATVVGGSWVDQGKNRDGVIVFGINNATGIQRVSWSGGVPSPVTAVNAARKDRIHAFPVFLPDGRHFLYFVISAAPENSGIYLGSLDSKPDHQEPQRLVASAFGAGFVPFPDGSKGAILFQRDGTLLAQPFDLRTLGTAGEAVPVAEQLGSYLSRGYFAASDNGTLAYRGDAGGGNKQLVWFDRQGKRLDAVGAPHSYGALALSPEGTRVAAARTEVASKDIWLTFSPGGETRFTFGPGIDRDPIWAPDGNRIAFSSNRAGVYDPYQHASNGAGQDELLFKSDHSKTVTDWSHDGRSLLYYDLDPKTKYDLWVLPMDGASLQEKQGERKPVPFLRTDFNELNAKFSPDGHWVAYQSDESGRSEIYVRPFPAPQGGGGKWMVSQGGGTQSRWRDSKELFYLAADGSVMAVPVSASGSAFQPRTPVALFKGPPNPTGWDVTADGKRFLFPVPAGETAQAPFTIVQNWMSLLKK